MKLWEIKHPYYCEEQQYFTNQSTTGKYKSWSEFIENEGNNDPDYNLLFRWDWSETEIKNDIDYSEDENYRNGELKLYWMLQRKGFHRSSIISVCRTDEPNVKEWLTERWQHLQKLWSPISGPPI